MLSADSDITPIRKQYLDIKREYPNAILFFRLGDFYETFDEDAEITARELDIVLTSRNVTKGVRVPMAGIPYHAVENYLARLLTRGYHVAICEQMGNEPIHGLVPRKVVRVLTPGTLLEPALLPGDASNYLASVVLQEDQAGIAYVDISTAEFAVSELQGADVIAALRAELLRLHPAEVIFPDTNPINVEGLSTHLTPWEAWHFEPGRCEEQLKTHFSVSSLEGFGLRGLIYAQRAAGAILQYLKETQPSALSILTELRTYHIQSYMFLDSTTRRNLELTETLRENAPHGSLLHVLDYTLTPMGKRLLRQWVSQPLLEVEAIRERQSAVQFFFDQGPLRTDLRTALKPLGDLERLTNRILSASVQPRDLIALRNTLAQLPAIHQLLGEVKNAAKDLPYLSHLILKFETFDEEYSLLTQAIAEDPPMTLQKSGFIRAGFSTELDEIYQRASHAREWIANLETTERARTGIKTLKVGYNKVFGYYIEVTKPNLNAVPPEYIRKQTLVNAERFITPEMKDAETIILNAEEAIRDVELRLFREICQKIALSAARLLATARAAATLDVLMSLAEAAVLNNYTCPEVVEEDVLCIYESRHPVVERMLSGSRFVPNDVVFAPDERIRIITGPNMSGKSTLLRQTALLVLMAQMGSFIPAREAKIGCVDRIFTRIGAQDEIQFGQSTFMVEMLETANILHHVTPRSLVILDEIGRGTSTYDGLSIAWALVEYLHNHPQKRAKTLFATHYHELTQLADLLPGVVNYNVAVSEVNGNVVFLHKIIPGGADRSYGIHVAQLAGLPSAIIKRAAEILHQLESSSGSAIKIETQTAKQLQLFPLTNPLLDELKTLDVNTLSPIEALNKIYEWKRRFIENHE